MATLVGPKGQVVIEKPIRDALGVKPGYSAVQLVVDNHVEIRFYPPEHNESLRGVLASKRRRTVSPDEWEEALEIAHEAWAREAMEGLE